VLRLADAVDEELQRLDGMHLVEDAAKDVELLEGGGREELLLLARARLVDVDRGPDALLGRAAVEDELHVARALELLEDQLVHLRARVDQRRREDRQRPAVLDVPSAREERLRTLEAPRVESARERAAAASLEQVVGAAEARQRVHEDDDV